jgi:hypothetical protein
MFSLFSLSQFQRFMPSSRSNSPPSRDAAAAFATPRCPATAVAFVCRLSSDAVAPFAVRSRLATAAVFIGQSKLHVAFLSRSLCGAPTQPPPSSLPRGLLRAQLGGRGHRRKQEHSLRCMRSYGVLLETWIPFLVDLPPPHVCPFFMIGEAPLLETD